MRGRKPKADAARRGTRPKEQLDAAAVEADVVEFPGPHAIEKPGHVAANPTMSACWDMVVGEGYQYAEADVPMLEQLCYWYAVYRQCVENTLTPEGGVVTSVARLGEDGEPLPATVKANPDMRTAQMAASNYRALATELGVTPLARQRMGLMEAVTHSTQADVVRKTEETYRRMKARLNAAD